MFFKKTKLKKEEEKESSTLDRIVMGIIIGGAIGSALGLGLAPDEGSKTIEKIKETSKV